jgi:L-amino acid N-acyltransferase YncA
MKIRKARKNEFKKIAELYKEGFSEKPFNEKWALKEAIEKIKIFSKYCDVWILIEKQIIGFIIINPNFWKMGELIFGEEAVIKKEYQHKGYGTKLFEHIFRHYKNKGYKKYHGIVHKKSNSWKFHKKLGCKKNNYDFLMEKNLK